MWTRGAQPQAAPLAIQMALHEMTIVFEIF
jgi:hypothetical protein